ncbi:MAG: methyltransferase [Prevotellaceae bacterium]|jgi:tRNA1Val (adenine37-N6)-methyltransferase|nr:methyltransferase [Prevotellaceae bacterium]
MFRFKQFVIHQDRCAMKVGTDGVLLGAWADVENAARILDIGTGTGLIAMMLAQRNPNACVDAIEIEENAYRQATENTSVRKERINVFHTPLQSFFPAEKYDVIVSNPPYFSHSLKNPDKSREIARHTDTLTLQELFLHSKRLLKPGGKLSIIFPAENMEEKERAKFFSPLQCNRLCKVFPKPNTKEKRLLMEFSLAPADCIESEIIIENGGRHEYSEEYKELTKDFYLKFV